MIIGNNNFNNSNNNFENKFKRYNDNANLSNNNQNKNVFVKNIQDQKYTNPMNNNDMYDKSLAMLHERLSKGLISLDEFNKKCEMLGKKRSK